MSRMTINQAKKKWCPFGRQSGTVVNDRYLSVNRNKNLQSTDGFTPCLADDCMLFVEDGTFFNGFGDEVKTYSCGLAYTKKVND